ncbi:glycosyltransferase family 2 protein [Polaribacter sp. SA4-12]|uniref:glycosyltransferase family 2 protein n=1 Tax=Polaribacter sp. SA4-12 TaxID=1312072 RepID=UPI000B3CFECF|nr:glycosyltransferase family 2 protein [Polaribacter sp. SA4-12]ARV13802.1 hypothetical protein BTO07_00985 [Polaribacter sp. SA4-12]
MKKKISIITINYNNLEGLKRTITSVANQTYKDFEYVIIDGGSIDGSADYIESKNNNIDYWVSEKDSGIYNAMNKGIEVANGEYLLFLNSGDELYSNNVLQENYNDIHTEDLIYFNICQVFETSTNIYSYPDYLSYKTFLAGTIGHPTTLIKRSLFHKFGVYDESLKIVSDWKFFFILVVKFNVSRRKINKTLSNFYTNGISSMDVSLVNFERNKVIESEFKDYLRLDSLEKLLFNLKRSRIIKLLNRFGLLLNIKEI